MSTRCYRTNLFGTYLKQPRCSPSTRKVTAIQEFPLPSTKRKLKEFLGLVNFYHCFIPHCAHIVQPINKLLTATHAEKSLQWDEQSSQTFFTIKQAFANVSLLAHPQHDAPTDIMMDASDIAVGAVLQEKVNDQWCPIAFFSKRLTPPETKYSTFDRELLAVYLAIKHFQHFIEGRDFHIVTDHKPLTFALKSNHNHSPRQFRHLDFISQFNNEIRHAKGTENCVAVALSRI